jgi:hypothetical protein
VTTSLLNSAGIPSSVVAECWEVSVCDPNSFRATNSDPTPKKLMPRVGKNQPPPEGEFLRE